MVERICPSGADRLYRYLKDARPKARSIGLLGFGKTNRAVYSALCERGFSFILRGAIPPSKLEFEEAHQGEDTLKSIREDVIFVSPSYRRGRELAIAEAEGCLVTSDCECFFSSAEPPPFAVSGSSGKSTTTALAAKLLEGSFKRVFPCGNFGSPYCALPFGECQYVCELSSFNLQYCAPRSRRAVLTNISPNHLDWHTDMQEYVGAKERLLLNCPEAVLGIDSPECARIARKGGNFAIFSTRSPFKELKGLFKAEHFVTLEGEDVCVDGRPFIGARELALIGEHNLQNLCAAIALCHDYVSREEARERLRDFCGLPHRLEKFLSFSGIDFIDSSIDTTPERVASSLRALGRSVRILIGGRGKGLSPLKMLWEVGNYARRIGFFGEYGIELYSHSASLPKGIECELFPKLSPAVDYVTDGAVEGDTVILCPGGSSYDEFQSFEERGEYFKNLIRKKYNI